MHLAGSKISHFGPQSQVDSGVPRVAPAAKIGHLLGFGGGPLASMGLLLALCSRLALVASAMSRILKALGLVLVIVF
jgi:hypothetical protein